MPVLLKLLTAHALACALFLLFSLVPVVPFRLYGEVVSFERWWQSGAGLGASMIGLFLPYAAVLLLQKASYARVVYLGILVVVTMGAGLALGRHIAVIILNLCVVGMLALYLYKSSAVRAYFFSNNTLEPTP